MRTAQLIDSLVIDVRPAEYQPPLSLLGIAVAAGGLVSLLAVLLVFGVQPGLGTAGQMLPFGMKLAYAVALGGVALALAVRLARPDGGGGGWRALAIPVAALGAVAAVQLGSAPERALPHALLGGSWDRCPWRIALLSLPVLGALLAALRRQAPTDPRRAGAAAGLLAGAAAAGVYALACTEASPAFVLVWYTLGIALSTALGALAGSRLLRW